MLMLLFKAGKNRFALDAELVLEVIPKVAIKPISLAPEYVPGFANFGGNPLPIVDFTALIEHEASKDSMHTRIILFKKSQSEKAELTFGLMVEGLTKTIFKDSTEFVDTGVLMQRAPYLHNMWTDDEGIVQILDLKNLNLYLKDSLSHI